MTNRQLVRRIITCQGSIQLVTALSVLRYREKEQQDQNLAYENYLVIYDLYTPPGQIEKFADFIKKMAEMLLNWQAITYISPEHFTDIFNKLGSTRPSKIFQMVHSLLGIEFTDEIYLCRNWQFGNQIFINAYPSAEKICYGDSIGIYFSSTSTAFFATVTETEEHNSSLPALIFNWLRSWKNEVKALIEDWKEKLEFKTVLETIEFDRGYFVLPDILGEFPPMPTVTLDKTFILNNFEKLTGLVDSNYIAQFQEKIAGVPVVILLTSNLSEAERMSFDNEIIAYREFLISEGVEQNTVLVVKPHPRDDITKIEKLKHALADLFSKILVLSEPELFFLPFEVFFLEAFLSSKSTLKNNIRVFAVSSACISLKLLFNVPSIVGFGDEITSKLFNESYITGRLAHEHQLKAAVQKLENSGFATNRLP